MISTSLGAKFWLSWQLSTCVADSWITKIIVNLASNRKYLNSITEIQKENRKDKVSFYVLKHPIADCFGLKQNGISIIAIIFIIL